MSIKLMAECWNRQMTRSERDVLLVMCDHANDEGRNTYPSIARIAWKTDMSERHVTRMMKSLCKKGALKLIQHATRHTPKRYRAIPSALPVKPCFRGDIVSPLEDLGVTNETSRGDIAMSPKPSVQPSIGVLVQVKQKRGRANRAHPSLLTEHASPIVAAYIETLRPAGITATNAGIVLNRVKELSAWQDVLTRWAVAQWNPTNFAGLFDAYDRAVNAARVAAKRGKSTIDMDYLAELEQRKGAA